MTVRTVMMAEAIVMQMMLATTADVAACPTAVCSIPSVKREDGSDFYVGGLIEVKGDRRTVRPIPLQEEWEF